MSNMGRKALEWQEKLHLQGMVVCGRCGAEGSLNDMLCRACHSDNLVEYYDTPYILDLMQMKQLADRRDRMRRTLEILIQLNKGIATP